MSDTDQPTPPTADDKDWTWVLHTPCPDCGFRATDFAHTDVAAMLRTNTEQWIEVLAADHVRTRPSPTMWSPLEYGCHVRDVHRRYLERLELMLRDDGPHFPNWDQDATAIEQRYHESDPATVAEELGMAAMALADRFDQVSGDQWDRTGFRSDGAEFTVATIAKYFIHDPIHHLHDVGVEAR